MPRASWSRAEPPAAPTSGRFPSVDRRPRTPPARFGSPGRPVRFRCRQPAPMIGRLSSCRTPAGTRTSGSRRPMAPAPRRSRLKRIPPSPLACPSGRRVETRSPSSGQTAARRRCGRSVLMAAGCVRSCADGRRPGQPTAAGCTTGGWMSNPARRADSDRRRSGGILCEEAQVSHPGDFAGRRDALRHRTVHFNVRGNLGRGSSSTRARPLPTDRARRWRRVAGERLPARLPNISISPDGQHLATLLIDGATTNIWTLPTAGGPMSP